MSYLGKADQAVWRRKLQAAYAHPSYADAKRALQRLVRKLRVVESAAASLEEGLENPPNGTINAILGQIYTGSLLYFISGVLEDDDDDTPIVGMERYSTGAVPFTPGAFPAVDSVQAFLGGIRNPYVHSDASGLAPQPALGLRSASHHHGGFPAENGNANGAGTLESVCYLLRTRGY